MAGPPPADDCADTLVLHAQSAEEMTGHMWELGFDTAEYIACRHVVVTQLPGWTVVVLLNEAMEVLHAESCEGIATEEDIRRWRRSRPGPPEVAPE